MHQRGGELGGVGVMTMTRGNPQELLEGQAIRPQPCMGWQHSEFIPENSIACSSGWGGGIGTRGADTEWDVLRNEPARRRPTPAPLCSGPSRGFFVVEERLRAVGLDGRQL